MKLRYLICTASILTTGCALNVGSDDPNYSLPFPRNSPRLLIQGNNGRHGHTGHSIYAFDFLMPPGSKVLAARSGIVIATEERYSDGDHVPGHENFVFVRHSDGTFARYYHLTFQGSLVLSGTHVRRGQLIGYSGDTGASAGPHLHFDVTRRCPEYGCPTIPITFTNSGSEALREGELYPKIEALN
jgi:murein DD-endopeptidase MepM/ murein hydrolase activator NlpD